MRGLLTAQALGALPSSAAVVRAPWRASCARARWLLARGVTTPIGLLPLAGDETPAAPFHPLRAEHISAPAGRTADSPPPSVVLAARPSGDIAVHRFVAPGDLGVPLDLLCVRRRVASRAFGSIKTATSARRRTLGKSATSLDNAVHRNVAERKAVRRFVPCVFPRNAGTRRNFWTKPPKVRNATLIGGAPNRYAHGVSQ